VEVRTDVAGRVWKIEVRVGDTVEADAPLLILESMKMEVPVPAPVAGTVLELPVGEGDAVDEDAVVAVLEPR
jgi:acetyl-CoA carboxylase biotin carboxyl carrier protein